MNIRGRVLALDLGTVRVGMALSDAARILATPHGTLRRGESDQELIDQILKVVQVEEVSLLVVGMPRSLREENSIAADRTQSFIKLLEQRSAVPVVNVDERFTTVLAERQLRASGHDSRSMKSKIDAVAATHILQSFLDSKDNEKS